MVGRLGISVKEDEKGAENTEREIWNKDRF
jgi:hypothetical protein